MEKYLKQLITSLPRKTNFCDSRYFAMKLNKTGCTVTVPLHSLAG